MRPARLLLLVPAIALPSPEFSKMNVLVTLALVAAAPIVAPNEAWTWVDFADSQCANGASTGIAVNPTPKSGDVLFYLQGGGACWDETTCYGLKSAANFITRWYTRDSGWANIKPR